MKSEINTKCVPVSQASQKSWAAVFPRGYWARWIFGEVSQDYRILELQVEKKLEEKVVVKKSEIPGTNQNNISNINNNIYIYIYYIYLSITYMKKSKAQKVGTRLGRLGLGMGGLV